MRLRPIGNAADGNPDAEPGRRPWTTSGNRLSLAEELAEEAARQGGDPQDRYERIKQGEIHIAELQKMSMAQLIDEARQENVTDVAGMKKQDSDLPHSQGTREDERV